MKNWVLALLICITALSVKGQKLFDIIEKKNVSKLKEYFKKGANANDFGCTKTATVADSIVNYDFSIIEWAATKDCQECLETIIENEKQVNDNLNIERELNKCVSHAVRNNNVKMFEYLIAKGVDITTLCESCHGQSPIQVALVYGNYDMFYRLLKLGAKTDELNIRKQNLIHILLINFEDNRKYPDAQGNLTIPAVDVAKGVLDTLLKRKVSVDDKSTDDVIAWMYAAVTNEPVLYDMVKKYRRPYDNKDLSIACKLIEFSIYYGGGEKAVYNNMFDKVVAEEGIELTKDMIDRNDLYGGSEVLITYTADMDNEIVFEKLMKYNPNIEAVDSKGNDAMWYALENENPKICSLLLDAGITISEKDYKFAAKAFKNEKALVEKFKKAVSK
jgi:ankyrin repeat protein